LRGALHEGSTQARVRSVSGTPLPSLSLDGTVPRSRIEVIVEGEVRYRRPFATPGYVEVYGNPSDRWARLPDGHEQVLVILVPDFVGSAFIVGTSPSGQWFRTPLVGR